MPMLLVRRIVDTAPEICYELKSVASRYFHRWLRSTATDRDSPAEALNASPRSAHIPNPVLASDMFAVVSLDDSSYR